MKAFGKVYPPYIDAYQISNWSGDDENGWTFHEFCEKLKSHAIDWGTLSIGEQFLREKQIKEINGLSVWCCGFWNKKSYVLIGSKGWYYSPPEGEFEIIEYNYPEEWDVT